MKKYTLLTEDRENVSTLSAKYFEGFTVTHSAGFWKGTAEKSAQVMILSDEPGTLEKVMKLANDIKATNRQDAVLLTSEECNSVLI